MNITNNNNIEKLNTNKSIIMIFIIFAISVILFMIYKKIIYYYYHDIRKGRKPHKKEPLTPNPFNSLVKKENIILPSIYYNDDDESEIEQQEKYNRIRSLNPL